MKPSETDMTEPCLICGKPVPEHENAFCCDGKDCGCMGQPINPCLCSVECDYALFHFSGTYEERRIASGIKLYHENEP